MHRYAIVLVTLAVTAGAVQADTTDRVVYFQVSYAKGDVKDLSRVPTDDGGILHVTRITRITPPGRSYEVLTTRGRQSVRSVNRGRTLRVDLTWNGKAWVGPKPKSAPVRLSTDTPPPPAATGMSEARGQEIVRTEQLLAALKRLDTKYASALTEAAKTLASAADEKAKATALEGVVKAKLVHDNCTKAVADAEKHLADLLAGKVLSSTTQSVANGRLARATDAPHGAGVIRPVEDSAVLPHRVQVWPLEAGTGRRTYRISIAHTEAGVYGGFYYVAYADTDGDGRPDKLIARSPLAQADHAGGWTVWTFETDAQRVFAGNTWQREDTTQFSHKRQRHDRDRNWSGLGNEIYVSGFFGAAPTKRHKFWPYLHNIRVQLNDGKRRKEGGRKTGIVIRE